MKINTLNDLYNISKSKLENQHGTITITFANRSHVYTGNDVIGNCLQEWLPNWFEYLGVNIKPGINTQEFPDFTAILNNKKYAVEIKTWNINNSPAFDLANFQSFLESTYKSPSKINARYFVLGYKPENDGFSQGFTVKAILLKNIWEMTTNSRKYPIGLQVKRGQPYAMRPYNFYKNPEKSFKDKHEFLLAVKNTFELFPNHNLPFSPKEWYDKVKTY